MIVTEAAGTIAACLISKYDLLFAKGARMRRAKVIKTGFSLSGCRVSMRLFGSCVFDVIIASAPQQN
jgi:hypothetical protein